MKEDLVSYETAKLAKEAGFDWPVNMFYAGMLRNKRVMQRTLSNFNMEEEKTSCPTQCLLAKWLREEKGIDVCIDIMQTIEHKIEWYYIIRSYSKKDGIILIDASTNGKERYDVFETGLQEALKYLKENENK